MTNHTHKQIKEVSSAEDAAGEGLGGEVSREEGSDGENAVEEGSVRRCESSGGISSESVNDHLTASPVPTAGKDDPRSTLELDKAETFLANELQLPNSSRRAEVVRTVCGEEGVPLCGALSHLPNFDARWAAIESTQSRVQWQINIRAAADRSALIRRHAIFGIATGAPDEEVVGVFEQLSYPLRRRLMCALRKARRFELMHEIITMLERKGDLSEMRRLFSLCGADLVLKLLPTQGEFMSLWQWNKVAKKHPALAADATLLSVRAMTCPDPGLLQQVKTIVPFTTKDCRSQIWEIFLILKKWFPSAALPLKLAGNIRPSLVADLLVHWQQFVPNAVEIKRVPRDRLCALAKLNPSILAEVNWSRKGIRRHVVEILDELKKANIFDKELIPTSLLERLPPSVRFAEARAMLTRPLDTTKELEYTSCLPYETASPKLRAALEDNSLAVRTKAFASLCRLVCMNIEEFDSLISTAREYVQIDIHKQDFFTALACLPAEKWHARHIETLDEIVVEVLRKRPNAGVYQTMADLLLKVFPLYPVEVARTLKRLEHTDHFLQFSKLECKLMNAESCKILEDVFMSALEGKENAWQRVSAAEKMIAGVGSFVKEFQRFITHVLTEVVPKGGVSTWGIDMMMSQIKCNDFAFFKEAVNLLIRPDLSFLQSSIIFSYLEQHDLDPIDKWLDSKCCVKGVLNEEGNPLFPHFFREKRDRTYLSVARQQRLQNIVRDLVVEHGDCNDMHWAISLLAKCHGLTIENSVLADLAKDTDRNPRLATSARSALCRHDDMKCLEFVLNNIVTKEDARDVIYESRGRLMLLNPQEALPLIQKFDISMVSTHKEVCRLLGDLRIKEPLMQYFDAEKTHRDVKVAIIRALWNWRDEESTWEFFMKQADHPEWKVARKLTFVSLCGVSSFGRIQLVRILLKCLQRPEVALRKAALERVAENPVADPQGLLTDALLRTAKHASPDELKLATTALFSYCAGPAVSAELAQEILELLSENMSAFKIGLEGVCNGKIRGDADATDKVLLACVSALDKDVSTMKLQLRAILRIDSLPLMCEKLLEYTGRSEAHMYTFLVNVVEYLRNEDWASRQFIDGRIDALSAMCDSPCQFLAAQMARRKLQTHYWIRDTLDLAVPISRLKDSRHMLVKSLAMTLLGPEDPDFSIDVMKHRQWHPHPPQGDIENLPGALVCRSFSKGRRRRLV